jgi:hypothetical protein
VEETTADDITAGIIIVITAAVTSYSLTRSMVATMTITATVTAAVIGFIAELLLPAVPIGGAGTRIA